MEILDLAFGHPRGLLGRLGGMIMARGSAERNAWTIQQLSSAGFHSTRCVFKQMKPIGSVCILGEK